jgi:hypothetical protein
MFAINKFCKGYAVMYSCTYIQYYKFHHFGTFIHILKQIIKMKTIALYSLLFFASCNTNKEKEVSTVNTNESNPETKSDKLSPGCYEMRIGKDSAIMNLSINGNNVSGKLDYKAFEKDGNKGKFSGMLDSNKITAWYTFESEGIVSVRQVVFKINGETLLEGYGDFEVTGDTAYFKYPHTLNFETNHPFNKVNCK